MAEEDTTYKSESGKSRIEKIKTTLRSLSPFERVVFGVFLVVFFISALAIISNFNTRILVEIPLKGGSITEGVIGSPRFVNPLLATSDSDRDLTFLVYSGLMRATPTGDLKPDLAQKYEISEDGRTYTFTLKSGLVFHDGTPITADDVVFTLLLAQDPSLKSPRRASWDGVFIEKIDEKTVSFTLPQPYSPFLENTTLGILPKHLWEGVSVEQFPFSQLNIEPIGSGPFAVNGIKRNSSGIPTIYTLSSFNNFALGEPHLESITLKFYPNEEGLIEAHQSKAVDAINSISPNRARALSNLGVHVRTSPLPRVFGVFFNQNQAEIFTDRLVRKALSLTVPRDRIINEILKGYATPVEGPIPPGLLNKASNDEETVGIETRVSEAKKILEGGGWSLDEDTGILTQETDDEVRTLSFEITTSNTPELKAVATLLKEMWESMGMKVELKFFEISDLNQNVIRPRKYDALLFGEIIGRELDLFSFWHSSQRNDPGLNIALYANITADKLLSDARSNSNKEERESLYQEFEKEVENDVPTAFLYSPDFVYVIPKSVRNLKLGSITTPGERFLNVHEWYIETEYVWPFFVKE